MLKVRIYSYFWKSVIPTCLAEASQFPIYFPHPFSKPACPFGLCNACSRVLKFNYVLYEKLLSLLSSDNLNFPLSSVVKYIILIAFKPLIIVQVLIMDFCGRLAYISFSEFIRWICLLSSLPFFQQNASWK